MNIVAERFILQNNQCKVTIKEIQPECWKEETYTQILNPAEYTRNDFTKAFSVYIDLYDHDIMLAIIGSYMSAVEDCALLDGHVLTVMMNEQFFKINVLDGTVIDYTALDVFGSNFALYKIDRGYVVYGEIEILFLNENFEKTASFSGRDIFVSISGKNPFTLTRDTVQLYDFEDNYYEIDFEGKIIHEHKAK